MTWTRLTGRCRKRFLITSTSSYILEVGRLMSYLYAAPVQNPTRPYSSVRLAPAAARDAPSPANQPGITPHPLQNTLSTPFSRQRLPHTNRLHPGVWRPTQADATAAEKETEKLRGGVETP